MHRYIKNFTELATTPERKQVLNLLDVGLQAINTQEAIRRNIQLEGNILSVMGQSFDLSQFARIKVVGFGKASCDAAVALEEILGNKINQGVVIGLDALACSVIETFAGSHPRPTHANALVGERIRRIVEESTEDDLLIVIISGGGSALLCSSSEECDDLSRLYDAFLSKENTIRDMNTVRKHISILKGGGLAKLAYPATVLGLVFSDVPGDNFEDVASGPTYLDTTTIKDAQKIIEEKELGVYNLIETTKDLKYFEKVHNFVLVANTTAVSAMEQEAIRMGLPVQVLSTELYDDAKEVARALCTASSGGVVLGAGEPKLRITRKGGSGGRNMYLAHAVLAQGLMRDGLTFASLASDGLDNSDLAGAIVDMNTVEKIRAKNLDEAIFYENYDSYNFFAKTNDLIQTGPTGSNVSDIMIALYTQHHDTD